MAAHLSMDPIADDLIGQIPAVVWTTDRSLRILSVHGNAAARVASSGAVGRCIDEYFPEGDSAVDVHRSAVVGQSGQYFHETAGSPWRVWVEPKRNDDGDIVGAVAVALDITDQQRSEQQLATAHAKMQSLVETLPLVVYTVSIGPDAEPMFISPQLEDLLGIPADDFTFLVLREGIHPDDRAAAYEAFDLADERGESLVVEYRFVRADGRVVWVQDSSRVTTIGGELVAQGYLLDITERKNSERALERRAAVRKLIVEIGRAFLTGARHDEVIEMCFDVLAKGLEADAGSYLEIVGEGLVVVDCFGWDARGEIADAWTPAGRARATKKVWRGAADRRAGTKLIEYGLRSSLAAPIILDDGLCAGALTVHAKGEDAFTADDANLLEQLSNLIAATMSRARADERLWRAERLEAVGQLAAGIAHDFNNLLTAIAGYTELAATADGPRSRLYLDQVLQTSDRARALTSQLLAFGRKQVLRPRPLRLAQLVSGALPMLAPLLPENVQVASILGDAVVLADEAQLENVLVNLMVNARDAMPDGGLITIKTDVVNVESLAARTYDAPAGRYGRLSVEDTGTGMTEEVLARAFEPFYTTKSPGKGTGLGLAGVEGSVRQTGGFMTVETVVGTGTRFCVYLPLSDDDVDEEPTLLDADAIDGGRALVVEDEGAVRELLEEQLRRIGLDVQGVGAGDDALELLATETFDLVLSDLGLPGMDGALLASIVRERYPDVRLILMSGYPHDVIESRGIQPDVTLLQKPFRLDELQNAVGRALADR